MKSEKPLIQYAGLSFDSNEEREFHWWCEEAKEDGLLRSFSYHPESFELSKSVWVDVVKQMKTKLKPDKMFLLHDHEYTPDYQLWFNTRLLESRLKVLKSSCIQDVLMGTTIGTLYEVWVDVKGGYSTFDDGRTFSINVKWMWQAYKLYMNKVIPKQHFKQFWLPERAKWTEKTRELKTPYIGLRNRDGFWNAC